MRLAVQSVLFRKLTNSNADMFLGNNRGEYDLRFGRLAEIQDFTDSIAEEDPTALGGWTKRIPVQPFDGAPSAPASNLRLRFMGPSGARSNDTYIASQTSDPYPLWAPARARPGASTAADLAGDVALLVKDVDGGFHGRYVRREDLSGLPAALQASISAHEKGVWVVPTPSSASSPSPEVQRVIDALRTHHNVLLYGPPGTGKTHLVTEVRAYFAQPPAVTIDTEAESGAVTETSGTAGALYSEWATFHQSYSYEDFLIGLRPQPEASGGFKLVPRPGILLELAEWARTPGHESLLIIDEINRGNVSRIFGEFITLIEPDKRLAPDGSENRTTVAVRLPFVDAGTPVKVTLHDGTEGQVSTPFKMPHAVYTLATMNSVDKSVAPLDAALRRRFHVLNISPDLEGFASRLALGSTPLSKADVPLTPTTLADARAVALALLQALNKRISLFLGPDFQFGEWFLEPLRAAANDPEGLAALAAVWRTKVMPQLEEYFVGRADQFAKVLGDPKDEGALIVDSPDTSYAELGAVQAIRANPRATDGDLVALVARIARSGLPPAPAGEAAEPGEVAEQT